MRSYVNKSLLATVATFVACLTFVLASPRMAYAHAAEQGFVLLLPTHIYIPAAMAVFVLTVVMITLLPRRATEQLFAPATLVQTGPPQWLLTATSLAATAVVFALVGLGYWGPRDPLSNLLPLTIWSTWWIGFVLLHLLVGGLWQWINPWTGLYQLSIRDEGTAPPLRLPDWLGVWPAVAFFLLFTSFSIADPAPEDPTRLAGIVMGYWVLTFVGMILFGAARWSAQCEAFTVFFRLISTISPVQVGPGLRLGMSGWGATLIAKPLLSLAVFCLAILGAGSFDGLNETFWWLAKIGVNPLEFPGRSQIILQTIIGFAGSITLLIMVFGLCVVLGCWLAARNGGASPSVLSVFCHLALATIPIGLGFHAAHFFTTILISAQYAVAAMTDPMAMGADYLGFGQTRVVVGFLRDADVVRWIWLTQATVIVASHVIAVLMAHAITRKLFATDRQARLAELPLSLFMVAYTVFGLWLLAAARGA